MPWNDNAGGSKPGGKKPNPWGDPSPGAGGGGNDGGNPPPPRGPTGGGGGGGGPRRRRPGGAPPPPDFGDLARKAQDRFQRLFGGEGGGGVKPGAIAVVAAAILALWAASGIYIVRANEVAVVRTFGAEAGFEGPGMNYHLPWPIQTITTVRYEDLNQTPVGGTSSSPMPSESLMLTGDENIIDLRFTVLWKVNNAENFVFNLRDPEVAIKQVSESAMREVVGRNALQPILTTARGQIQTQVADLTQRVLDSYGAGILIQEIQISEAGPPSEVVEAFREVQSAGQDAEAQMNRARGEAAQLVQAAIGYKAQAIREAEGEAAAFNQVYGQYKLAPAVTRQRLYIETMEKVLAKSRRIIVDNDGASAPIILPPDAFRPNPSAPQARPQAGAPR